MARRLKTRKKGKTGAQDLTGNPDFRARTNFPLPPVAAIERRLRAVLTPGLFAARRVDPAGSKLRDRLLTLPVMAVLMVSLVWRQLPSLSEALRVVAREGLWDLAPFRVSRQALSQRLQALPAALFAHLYEEALQRLRPPGDCLKSWPRVGGGVRSKEREAEEQSRCSKLTITVHRPTWICWCLRN